MKNIISEGELKRMVKKVVREEKLNNINEALPRRERERHQTNWRKKNFEPYDREKEIMGAFGSYRKDVPPNVISYLRKNPRTFLQRIVDIYGMDKVLDFIGYTPEMTEGYDNYMTADDLYGSNDVFSQISKNVDQVSNDEAMEYLDEIINYCIGIQEELGYDNYMDDVHEEEKWIQKAIEKPGSLRRKMGKKKGEKISKTDIKNKLASLKAKDEDPKKPGVQGLGKRDLRTYRQLNLAKTLRGLK